MDGTILQWCNYMSQARYSECKSVWKDSKWVVIFLQLFISAQTFYKNNQGRYHTFIKPCYTNASKTALVKWSTSAYKNNRSHVLFKNGMQLVMPVSITSAVNLFWQTVAN